MLMNKCLSTTKLTRAGAIILAAITLLSTIFIIPASAQTGDSVTVARVVKRTKKGKPVEEQTVPQGIVVGCQGNTTALVDTGDVHVLMIGAAGVGKTAFWLYPCIEYACASGMSFLSTDTKGDVLRNYGNIAKDYGYKISVIDLRNPTRSNGNNLLHLVNKYMDMYQANPDQLARIIHGYPELRMKMDM